MASTPRFKVYKADGEYIAACKYPYDAAAIIAGTGDTDWTIRDGHTKVVWREGAEQQPAGESYDFVASTVYDRTTRRW